MGLSSVLQRLLPSPRTPTRAPHVQHTLTTPAEEGAPIARIEPEPSQLEHKPLRTRQELLGQLQRNYAEVIGLVRKIDTHLDEHTERTAESLEMTRRLPELVNLTTGVRAEQAGAAASLRELVELTRATESRLGSALEQQAEVMERTCAALEQASACERALGESVAQLGMTLSRLDESTASMRTTAQELSRQSGERQRALESALAVNQRWLVAIAGICAAGTIAAAIVGLIIVFA